MAQQNAANYKYRPLQGEEIRLIAIKPFNEAVGRVECSLHQEPLGSVPFDALSYYWGDANITEPILLDGQPFGVTTNLARCLTVLAQQKHAPKRWPNDSTTTTTNNEPSPDPDRLWVDAICINQANLDERAAQVLRMRDIYALATEVIAWLGDAAPSTPLAFAWIAAAAAAGHGARATLGVNVAAPPSQTRPFLDLVRELMAPAGAPTLAGINDFFGRPWWRRAWVVQEAVRARALQLVCGVYSLPYTVFGDAWAAFYQAFAAGAEQHMVDAETRLHGAPSMIFNVRVAASWHRPMRLAELLRFTRRAEAQDPRDKVFALLGISEDMARGEIGVDYKLEHRQVYVGVVKTHLAMHGSLDILEGCDFRAWESGDWPSWIPDWKDVRERPTEFSWSPGFTPAAGLYDACAGLKLDSGSWLIADNGNSLHVPGVVVDSITLLSDMAAVSSHEHQNQHVDAVLRAWLDLLPDHHARYSFTGETVDQAFRRTMVVDRRVGIAQNMNNGFSRPFALTFPWERPEAAQDPDSAVDFQDGVTGFMMVADIRRLAITSRGMLGLVPSSTRIGDEITVLTGGQFPYVVRRVPLESAQNGSGAARTKDVFRLLGEAYVHGIMDGEAMAKDKIEQMTFV